MADTAAVIQSVEAAGSAGHGVSQAAQLPLAAGQQISSVVVPSKQMHAVHKAIRTETLGTAMAMEVGGLARRPLQRSRRRGSTLTRAADGNTAEREDNEAECVHDARYLAREPRNGQRGEVSGVRGWGLARMGGVSRP